MTDLTIEIAQLPELEYVNTTDWLVTQPGVGGTPLRKISVESLFAGRPNTLADIVDNGTVTSGAIELAIIPQTVNVMILGAANTAVTVTTTALSTQLLLGMIIVTQDGSGLRTITWPASFRWQGGFPRPCLLRQALRT